MTDIAEVMSDEQARLEAAASEIGQHERDALAEVGEREQAVIDEFESSGYWQSGYVDNITGEVREFDHKPDYEDALGQIVSPIYHDLWENEGTIAQRDGARTIIENANDGDPVEIDLGSRHYFVREVGANESDEYDFDPRQNEGMTP
jgi:hypothetical protein